MNNIFLGPQERPAQDILPLPNTKGTNAWTLPPFFHTPSFSAERELCFAISVFGLKVLSLSRQIASSATSFDPVAFKPFVLTNSVRAEF